MAIEARESIYNGTLYRSQTEATWARIFDVLGISFEYETKTFALETDLFYLPDFWLPEPRVWVEIKGDVPNELERQKALGLNRVTGDPVLIFSSTPIVMTISTGSGYVKTLGGFGVWLFYEQEMARIKSAAALLGLVPNDPSLKLGLPSEIYEDHMTRKLQLEFNNVYLGA